MAVDRQSFTDYSGGEKSLELRRGAIDEGERILIVDDWIETGAQVQAAIRLVERSGGVVAGISAIHMDRNANTEALREEYRVRVASWLEAGD